MADIFIYSTLPLREARGGLEDDLDDFLGDNGQTTGGGGGERGWNIDLEVADDDLPTQIEKIRNFLEGWGVPPDTFFDVWQEKDGKEETTRYDVFDTSEILEWVDGTLTFLAKRLAANPSGWQAVQQRVQLRLSEPAQSVADKATEIKSA